MEPTNDKKYSAPHSKYFISKKRIYAHDKKLRPLELIADIIYEERLENHITQVFAEEALDKFVEAEELSVQELVEIEVIKKVKPHLLSQDSLLIKHRLQIIKERAEKLKNKPSQTE